MQAVTANYKMEMPSWYAKGYACAVYGAYDCRRFDIIDFSGKSREDEEGMLKVASSLNAIISEEIDNGIAASRIVLGGFSQGGAMSLLTGLTSERKLGGLAILSGWLPLQNKLKAVCRPALPFNFIQLMV